MGLIKTKEEIALIIHAGQILREVKQILKESIKVGVTPKELDKLAEDYIRSKNAEPAFKGYQPNESASPFPSTICASLNEVIVHDVPSSSPLKNADVFKVDTGVRFKGYNTDSAFTVIVGQNKDRRINELITATSQALELGIEQAKKGNTLGDIGHAIESKAKEHGLHVVRGLSGHGIGKEVHEDPHVFNFGRPGEGMELRPGMVLAIEPMFALGTGELVQTKTGGYATSDGSNTAHFEHTILIADDKAEILT